MAVFIQSPAGIISTMTKLFLVLLGEPQESLSRPRGGPRTPCWEPLTAHLIRVFILVVFYLLSSSLIFTNAGRSASALQVSWRRSACATARLVTEKGLPLSQCSITPKPHCRTCSFVISRFLSLPPHLLPTSARSEHRSRIITPQRNLSAGCHLIFFPPQTQSVIRNPSCHADAIFGAECLLPHFF